MIVHCLPCRREVRVDAAVWVVAQHRGMPCKMCGRRVLPIIATFELSAPRPTAKRTGRPRKDEATALDRNAAQVHEVIG